LRFVNNGKNGLLKNETIGKLIAQPRDQNDEMERKMSYRDGLTGPEKKIWDGACALSEDMLNDFKSKNLLRKGTSNIDRERLMLIWENSRNYGMAFNEMQKIFDTKETFLKCASSTGLAPQTLTYAFVSQLVGTALISFESVFKTSLLFFLVEESGIRRTMTLGQLLGTIEQINHPIGKRLKDMIDTRIRNSLAHGTFWFTEGGRVFLATNSYLNDVDEMALYEFWIEIKKMNIISIAFTYILDKKIGEDYFRA
jgi:hypothetical protein